MEEEEEEEVEASRPLALSKWTRSRVNNSCADFLPDDYYIYIKISISNFELTASKDSGNLGGVLQVKLLSVRTIRFEQYARRTIRHTLFFVARSVYYLRYTVTEAKNWRNNGEEKQDSIKLEFFRAIFLILSFDLSSSVYMDNFYGVIPGQRPVQTDEKVDPIKDALTLDPRMNRLAVSISRGIIINEHARPSMHPVSQFCFHLVPRSLDRHMARDRKVSVGRKFSTMTVLCCKEHIGRKTMDERGRCVHVKAGTR